MSKLMAVAEREIRQYGFVFYVAALVAVVPYLSILNHRGTFADRLQFARMVGIVGATAFILGLAAMLGVSMIGREARENRLSFYFARPIAASSIWFGKVAASIVLILGCAAIMYLPNIGIADAQWREWWLWDLVTFIPQACFLAVFVLLAMHAAATMVRSRSRLILVDFAASLAFLWTSLLVIDRLILQRDLYAIGQGHEAVMSARTGTFIIFVAVVLVLLGGGAWQLSRGRVDPKRSHLELSKFVWSCLGAVIAVMAVITW